MAASDTTDTRASFSNYGTCVDIIGPVSFVLSTIMVSMLVSMLISMLIMSRGYHKKMGGGHWDDSDKLNPFTKYPLMVDW